MLLLCVVVMLTGTAELTAETRSDRDKVKAMLQTQARLLRQNRIRLMYRTTYTARFRAHCSWDKYVRRQRYARSVLGPGFTVRNIRVRFRSPTQAILAYQYVRRDGSIAADVRFRDGDLYAKQGNRWYDEWAHARDC